MNAFNTQADSTIVLLEVLVSKDLLELTLAGFARLIKHMSVRAD